MRLLPRKQKRRRLLVPGQPDEGLRGSQDEKRLTLAVWPFGKFWPLPWATSSKAKSRSPLLSLEPLELLEGGPPSEAFREPPSDVCRIWWLIKPLIWLALLPVRGIFTTATGAAGTKAR